MEHKLARPRHNIKPMAYAAVMFITLGLTIANETLSQLGLEQNYVIFCSVGFIVASLLLSRHVGLIMAVIVGVVTINLPDATLARYYLDRDVLLAFVCALILLPTIYHLLTR